MEMLYLMLFFIALLAVSFIRLLITNSAIYAVKVRKFTDKKRFILKSSVFSELGILISFFLFSLMCLCVSNFDNIFKKIADSILFGFLGNLTITGSGHYSGIIVAFFEILTAYAFIYLFNQTVVYKNLNVPEKQKSKLLHIVSLCNVPYLLFIPILKISFVSNIMNNIIIGMIY